MQCDVDLPSGDRKSTVTKRLVSLSVNITKQKLTANPYEKTEHVVAKRRVIIFHYFTEETNATNNESHNKL